MGRSPCCDKVGLKKGPWTPEEDQKLLAYIEEHGHGSWRALPTKAGLQRCGKSCRLRWTNYLRPDIKRGKFSLQEEQTIIQLHALLGNRWSAIATHLPKRTDNEIKNYWNTHLKKRLTKMGIDPVSHKPKNDTLLSGDGQSKSTANLSHMAQWESARLEAEARLVKQSKLRSGSGNAVTSQQNQKRLGADEPSPAPAPVSKPVVIQAAPQAPRCLDILKAWNGVWGNKPVETAAGEINSPTSTLSTTGIGESSTNLIEFGGNSSGSCDGGTAADDCEEEWKSFGSTNRLSDSALFPPGFHELTMSTAVDNAWMTAGSSSENVSGGKFLESFTDLLLSSTAGSDGCRSNYTEGGGDSDIGLSCGGGGGGDSGGYYWNNILNLVNSSSPSDSPMF